MRTFIFLISLCCFSIAVGQQNTSTLDSVKRALNSLQPKEQLKLINQIPYGSFVAEVQKAEHLFQKGEQIAIEVKDSTTLGDLIFKQGQLKAYQNKLDESLELSLRAIAIFEKNKNYAKAGIAYGGLGYNIKSRNLEKGLQYMRKSINLLEQANNLADISGVYDNYGVLLSLEKKNDSALYYQKKSLRIKKELKDSIGLGYSYANIANTFAEKQIFETAKKYVDSSYSVRTKIADNFGVTVSYVQKAEIFMLEGNYEEAIQNFEKCARLANTYQYKHLEQYCYEHAAKAYLKLNDYQNAYLLKEKFQTLKDSSSNVQTNNRIEELQIQFETEKKEKLLVEAKTAIFKNEIQIKNRTNWLIIAFGLAFLLGLIGFLVYKQEKLRNTQIIKENDLKQALVEIENQNSLQEQRIAISKDLHDNIGSQLTFIISSLDNLKYFEFAKEKLYAKFDGITNFTRNTITDLRDTIWAMNKERITFEDVKTRTTNFIEAANASLLGIQFEFTIQKTTDELAFNSLQGIDVYRIIQEAINNAIKHAKATEITVHFKQLKTNCIIEIIDNGIGLDLNEMQQEGNGLNFMKARAKEINADLSFEKLQNGTKVLLKLNLKEYKQ